MDKHLLKKGLKQNWYLVLALIICLLAILYKLVGNVLPDNLLRNLSGQTQKIVQKRLTPEEQALKKIQEYEDKISKTPFAPEVPLWRLAIGNICCQKLRDYEDAARNYELLILDHPDCEVIRIAYAQLEQCYEKLGDWENKRWIYTEMMKNFPENSSEYRHAKAKLEE